MSKSAPASPPLVSNTPPVTGGGCEANFQRSGSAARSLAVSDTAAAWPRVSVLLKAGSFLAGLGLGAASFVGVIVAASGRGAAPLPNLLGFWAAFSSAAFLFFSSTLSLRASHALLILLYKFPFMIMSILCQYWKIASACFSAFSRNMTLLALYPSRHLYIRSAFSSLCAAALLGKRVSYMNLRHLY